MRRKCTDHLIITGDRHLRQFLRLCVDYYNADRTHDSLGKDALRRAEGKLARCGNWQAWAGVGEGRIQVGFDPRSGVPRRGKLAGLGRSRRGRIQVGSIRDWPFCKLDHEFGGEGMEISFNKDVLLDCMRFVKGLRGITAMVIGANFLEEAMQNIQWSDRDTTLQ